MRAQGLDRVEVAHKFGLGQSGMNLLMTDLMQQNRWTALASFEFWDQMMQAAASVGDRAVAKRTDRIAVRHDGLKLAPERGEGKRV